MPCIDTRAVLGGLQNILEGFILKIKGHESGVPIPKRRTKTVERPEVNRGAQKHRIRLGRAGKEQKQSVKGSRKCPNLAAPILLVHSFIRPWRVAPPQVALVWFGGRIVAQGWHFPAAMHLPIGRRWCAELVDPLITETVEWGWWKDFKPSYSTNRRPVHCAFKRQILGVGGLALVSTKQNESEDGFLVDR